MPGSADDLEIIAADESLASELTRIALDSKRSWGYPERWIEIWRGELTIEPEYLARAHVHVARLGGANAGFYGLSGSPPDLVLDHLWIDPPSMGRGLGTALLRHALAKAAALGGRRVELDADPNAEEFYTRMGGKRTGQTRSNVEGQERFLPRITFEISGAGDRRD